MVVQRLQRTHGKAVRNFWRTARGCKHRVATGLAKLDGRRANSACAGVHQHRLMRLQCSLYIKIYKCGQRSLWQCCRLRVTPAGRHMHQHVCRHSSQRSVAATGQQRTHILAYAPASHRSSHANYAASHLKPQHF